MLLKVSQFKYTDPRVCHMTRGATLLYNSMVFDGILNAIQSCYNRALKNFLLLALVINLELNERKVKKERLLSNTTFRK